MPRGRRLLGRQRRQENALGVLPPLQVHALTSQALTQRRSSPELQALTRDGGQKQQLLTGTVVSDVLTQDDPAVRTVCVQ